MNQPLPDIRLDVIHTIDGVEHFVELQRRVWGGDPLEIVPNHVTVTVLKNGGALLGAYADDGPPATGGMVGAAFWWLGAKEGKLKVCSHMAGVLPEWQGRKVGLLLKQRQRELVLAQGLTDWITWTYDPLQRVNAVFNIRRLGATCNSYYRNAYGTMNDALNAGTPSDRFQVDWHLCSERTLRALDGTPDTRLPEEEPWQILPTTLGSHGLRQPVACELRLAGAPIVVPIPADINQIRRADHGLGLAWRLYMREVFEAAFAAGYSVTDCVHLGEAEWHYLLTRPERLHKSPHC
jgi:predicted GNAT superfamily acetyltransferase